jgi:hypothetical protein
VFTSVLVDLVECRWSYCGNVGVVWGVYAVAFPLIADLLLASCIIIN